MNRIIVLAIIFLQTSLFGEGLKTPKEQVDQFFKSVMNNQIEKAFANIFEGTELGKSKPDQAKMVARQTSAQLPVYGKLIGIDYVDEKLFGNSVTRLLFIMKTEKGPITWVFHFYNKGSKWELINVNFKDDVSFLQ